MKTIIRLLLSCFSAIVVVGTLDANVIRDRPTASQIPGSDGQVAVRWQTLDESSVLRFEIWRAKVISGDQLSEFSKVGEITQLKGNNYDYTYEFVDQSAFKTSSGVFAYKIRVVFQNQSYSESEVVKTSVISSAAKRTWGSIKAMFR